MPVCVVLEYQAVGLVIKLGEPKNLSKVTFPDSLSRLWSLQSIFDTLMPA
jgi:hypothetical protein